MSKDSPANEVGRELKDIFKDIDQMEMPERFRRLLDEPPDDFPPAAGMRPVKRTVVRLVANKKGRT